MTLKRSIPDFFIIGAPKCGTTSIYSYLKTHSQLFMPQLKEPHFFCTDLPGLAQVSGMNSYRRLFIDAPAGNVIGEASVWYFFSHVAAKNIVEINPEAKFVVVLRNPVDAAAALHSQFLRSGKENELELEDAWHLQFERRRGQSLPVYSPEPRCLQYREVFSYAPQLERLVRTVPARQVKVYIFEEIFCDPRALYLDLLAFLDVDDDHRRNFDVENVNRTFRARWIGMLLTNLPENTRHRLTMFRKAAHVLGVRPAELFLLAATKPVGRRPLRKEFRRYLAAEFASDVERLEHLLGRPLAVWRERDCFSHLSTDEAGAEHPRHDVASAERQPERNSTLDAVSTRTRPRIGVAS